MAALRLCCAESNNEPTSVNVSSACGNFLRVGLRRRVPRVAEFVTKPSVKDNHGSVWSGTLLHHDVTATARGLRSPCRSARS